jgi:phosphoribosyl-AMP cyclohydrolase
VTEQSKTDIFGIKFDADGLVPVIAQDHKDGAVLMMAYMNRESLEMTLQSGKAVYWSRSRKKLWKKGEESGNVQHVKALYKDCDGDTLLIKIEQVGGAACHTGHRSCFFSERSGEDWKVVGTPLFNPAEVYKKK